MEAAFHASTPFYIMTFSQRYMADIRITSGHNLKLAGRPEPTIVDAPRPARVAVQPGDFRYLRPRLKVQEGDTVKIGTPLFENKDDLRQLFVAPAAGKVAQVVYGARRKILEIVIEVAGEEGYEDFGSVSLDTLDKKQLTECLLKSGLWPLLRQRPFAKIATPEDTPKAIVVSATPQDLFDADPNVLLNGQEELFQAGLNALGKLGPVHLCRRHEASAKALTQAQGVTHHTFAGTPQAGNAAVQIFNVCPPADKEVVWYLGAQDVLAIAQLLKTGKFPVERIVTVAGPAAQEPKYYRTRFGASIASLTVDKVADGELRYVSGGPLTGRTLAASGYLGFYPTQLTVLTEGRSRELLSFFRPGFNKYSLSRAWASAFLPKSAYDLNTNKNGSERNFVLQGIYEDVCPVELLPQQLAKTVMAGDIEGMEEHGILDCAECGLCSFVCPSKVEVASIIREGIDQMHKEA
jgi:Na+-transporting NADH:ubiquinone oxidoreductase subunit A